MSARKPPRRREIRGQTCTIQAISITNSVVTTASGGVRAAIGKEINPLKFSADLARPCTPMASLTNLTCTHQGLELTPVLVNCGMGESR